MNLQETRKYLYYLFLATALIASLRLATGKPEISQAQEPGNNLNPSHPSSLIEKIETQEEVQLGPIADIGPGTYSKDIAIYQLPNEYFQVVQIAEGDYGVGIEIDGMTATTDLELTYEKRIEISNTPDYSKIKPVIVSNGNGQFLGFYELRKTREELPDLNLGVVYLRFNNGQLEIEKSEEIPSGSYGNSINHLYPQQGIVTISPTGDSRYTILSHLGIEGEPLKQPGLFHIDSDFNITPVRFDTSECPSRFFLPEQMIPIDNNHILAVDDDNVYAVFDVNSGERTTNWGIIPDIYAVGLTRLAESSGKIFFAAEETQGPGNNWERTGTTHFFEIDPQTMETTDILQIYPDVHQPQLIPLSSDKFLLVYGNGYNTPGIQTATIWGQIIKKINGIWQIQGNPFIVSSPNGQSDYNYRMGSSRSNFIGEFGIVSWDEGESQQARMIKNPLTSTPTQTPSPSATETSTPSNTPSSTATETTTPSSTPSSTATATETTTPSRTPSPSATPTPPNKPTATPPPPRPTPSYRINLPIIRR